MTNIVIEWTPTFTKQLKKMDKSIKEEIIKKIEKLKENPEIGKPLGNVLKNCLEERVRKYRIIYNYYNYKLTLIYIHDKEKGSHDNALINAAKNFRLHFLSLFIDFKFITMRLIKLYFYS